MEESKVWVSLDSSLVRIEIKFLESTFFIALDGCAQELVVVEVVIGVDNVDIFWFQC